MNSGSVIYTTSQMFLNSIFFCMYVFFFFLRSVFCRPSLFYLIQSTAKTVEFWNNVLIKITSFYINIFLNITYSCDFKAEFLASSLQSHDPSEIIVMFWFAAKKLFIIISIIIISIIIIIIIFMLKTAE